MLLEIYQKHVLNDLNKSYTILISVFIVFIHQLKFNLN